MSLVKPSIPTYDAGVCFMVTRLTFCDGRQSPTPALMIRLFVLDEHQAQSVHFVRRPGEDCPVVVFGASWSACPAPGSHSLRTGSGTLNQCLSCHTSCLGPPKHQVPEANSIIMMPGMTSESKSSARSSKKGKTVEGMWFQDCGGCPGVFSRTRSTPVNPSASLAPRLA
eukprot:1299972-Rhodomonas_salina.1